MYSKRAAKLIVFICALLRLLRTGRIHLTTPDWSSLTVPTLNHCAPQMGTKPARFVLGLLCRFVSRSGSKHDVMTNAECSAAESKRRLPQPRPNAPPRPAHNGKAYWIKGSAQQDGSFMITEARNGLTKTYALVRCPGHNVIGFDASDNDETESDRAGHYR